MKKKGFTLIEIMIVLLVFSIGVLAVLRLILHNISTMGELQARTTATILAKEGLELAYNTRDSNRIASLERDCIINNQYNANIQDEVCKYHFLDYDGRTIEVKEDKINRSPLSKEENGQLFLETNEQGRIYNHQDSQQPSIYSRIIRFKPVKDNEENISTGQILKIESQVIYQKGSKTGEVFLEGFIGNY